MTANPVLWNLDERGVATVTLNRPEVNNAYDAGLINGVLAAMDELGKKPNLRVVVLKGNGKHFQAGADLKWINGVRPKSPEENEAVSRATFEAVQRLNTLADPDGGAGAGRLLRRRHRRDFGLRRRDRGRQRAVLDHRSALGADGGDHHPATLRRHRRAPGPPLRADRRALWRGGRAPHRPRARGGAAGRSRNRRRQGRRAIAGQRPGGAGRNQGAGDGKLVRRHERRRRGLCAAGADAFGASGRPQEASEGLASFAEKRAANWK